MESKLWALLALILSCQLTPIIHAGKPVVPRSHLSVTKSESSTTIAPPAIKQVQRKNAELRKLFAENSSKKLDSHKSGSATEHLDVPSELKSDTASYFPWNTMPISFPMPSLASMFDGMSKFMPFFGYPPPLFVPYPVMMPSDMFYPTYADSQSLPEDTMSRTSGNGRRPVNGNNEFLRNSPIYYVRLPPTPYMFMPSFNYAPSPFFPYAPLSTFHALPMSSVFNLPMNFLANGKPNGIYRIDSASNELSSNHLPFTGARPTPFTNPFRPLNLSPSTQSSSFSLNHPNAQYSFPSPSTASTNKKTTTQQQQQQQQHSYTHSKYTQQQQHTHPLMPSYSFPMMP